MKVQEETVGHIGIVMLAGRLDSSTSPDVDDRLVGAPLAHQDMVIDCAALEFLSSAGLRVLLRLYKKLGPSGGRLVLCSATAGVREVLEISGLAEFLPVVDTRELAMERLSRA